MDYATIIALVLGMTQVFKQFGYSDRFTPIFAVLMGILINSVANIGGTVEQALWGIVAGLTAVGLYSGTKTVVTGK
jgi:hypothetical protein